MMNKRISALICALCLSFSALPVQADETIEQESVSVVTYETAEVQEEIVPEPPSYAESVLYAKADNVTLSWDRTSDEEKYDIKYTVNSGKTFSTLKMDYEDNTFSLSSGFFNQGSCFDFYIKPYKLVGEQKSYIDGYKIAVRFVPDDMTGKLNAVSNSTSVTLSWDKVNKAQKYKIYLLDGEEETLVGETTALTYKYNAASAQKLTFRVVPVSVYDDYEAASQKTLTVSTATAPKPASGLKISKSTDKSVSLTWDKTECTKYIVYRKTTGSYQIIGMPTANSFTDSFSKNEGHHIYIVRAVMTDDNGKDHNGALSAVVKKNFLKTPVLKDSISGLNAIRVCWNKAEGAQYYKVFIYKNGAWSEPVITKSLFYTFEGLDSKTTYLFHVKPCVKSDGKEITTQGASTKVVTDSRLRAKTNFVIYEKASTSSKVLYRGDYGDIIQQKGITDVSGWYKVYVPGTAKAKVGYVRGGQIAAYANLGIKAINQNGWEGGSPMVMGCESAALATVLQNQHGISCSKNDIANNYTHWVSHGAGDPNYAFFGSPYVYTGNDGIYAPAIAQAANWFLSDKKVRNNYQIDIHTDFNSTVNWRNLSVGSVNRTSGLDLAGIKRELNKGHALIVWFTTYNASPRTGGYYTIKAGGKYSNAGSGSYTFRWVAPQHCAVITGFDDLTQRITIADVINGSTVTYPYSTFMNGYNALGRQTVVIDKK